MRLKSRVAGAIVVTLMVQQMSSGRVASGQNEEQSGAKTRAGDGLTRASIDEIELPERTLPRFDLLRYIDAAGVERTVRDRRDWQSRRQLMIESMLAVMGSLPGKQKRTALKVKVDEVVDCGAYERRLIRYQSEPGCFVPAYLCVPKTCLVDDPQPHPAILCLHPTDDQVGHKVVVGLGGRPNRQYGSELAERGYVTLSPAYPLLANYQPDVRQLGWESGSLKAVWDNRRGIDFLQSLTFVASKRIGAIGHSLGGHNAVFTAVFDDRIRVVVSSCGLDAFVDYYQGNPEVWLPEKGWCQTRYIPRLQHYQNRLKKIPFDFPEMIGALAPRHVLIIAPLEDSNFRAESVDRVVDAASAVYRLLEVPERLLLEHPNGGHDFPDEMRQRAYQLFDEVLGPESTE